MLYQKTLSAPKTIVSVTDAFPSADGSVTLYGTAMANSRKLFTLYRLDLDAQGISPQSIFAISPPASDICMTFARTHKGIFTPSHAIIKNPSPSFPLRICPRMTIRGLYWNKLKKQGVPATRNTLFLYTFLGA